MSDKDQKIASFVEMTQANPENARAILEASNWELEDALNLFYASPEETAAATSRRPPQPQVSDEMEDDWEAPQNIRQSTPPPAGLSTAGGRTLADSGPSEPAEGSSAPVVQPPRRRGGLMTLGDLGSSRGPPAGQGHDHDDDDEDDEHPNLFTGGEKSGLAVENPGRQGNRGLDSVRNILKQAQAGSKARQQQPEDDEEEATPTHFGGRGQTLGSDDTPSRVIGDAPEAVLKPPPKVTRNLYFWRDGFSIEDGPLMRYDDPANQDTLRGIEAGKAPLHLMNVQPGQFTDVNVHRKMDEDYVQPKKEVCTIWRARTKVGCSGSRT